MLNASSNKSSTSKPMVTVLLNWKAIAYHTPLYLAQAKGLFTEEGIRVALFQPNDPSDVTEMIGSGRIDLGLKAMIHTLAGKARGQPIKAIGTLLDEPFTGVVYLRGGRSGLEKAEDGIQAENFASLRGKKIGYVGEFGRIQLDELCTHFGMTPNDYTPVRCGMNVSQAIIRGDIDAGIGLENVQMVELAEWLAEHGRPRDDVQMLRIDELADLGCCCFCSILYIGNERFLAEHPDEVRKFMRACKRATDYMLKKPEQAFQELVDAMPNLGFGTPLQRKIFERSFAYFSESLANVQRDWNKVTAYGKRLDLLQPDFVPNWTNEFLTWPLISTQIDVEETGAERQAKVAEVQRQCSINGGFRRVPV